MFFLLHFMTEIPMVAVSTEWFLAKDKTDGCEYHLQVVKTNMQLDLAGRNRKKC